MGRVPGQGPIFVGPNHQRREITEKIISRVGRALASLVMALTVPLMLPTPADAVAVTDATVKRKKAAVQQSTKLIRCPA